MEFYSTYVYTFSVLVFCGHYEDNTLALHLLTLYTEYYILFIYNAQNFCYYWNISVTCAAGVIYFGI